MMLWLKDVESRSCKMSQTAGRVLFALSTLLLCQSIPAAEPQAPQKSLPLRLSAPIRPKQLPPTAPAAPFRYTEATHGAGSLKYIGDIAVFTLQGTPEE